MSLESADSLDKEIVHARNEAERVLAEHPAPSAARRELEIVIEEFRKL